MIPAILDHRWLHPWRRPAEAARPVRLSGEPVRVVSPLPPYEPEPWPAEPWAPVYDYMPAARLLGAGQLDRAPSPRWPDRLVFGKPWAGRQNEPPPASGGEFRHCWPCGVKWRGDPRCWACGRPV